MYYKNIILFSFPMMLLSLSSCSNLKKKANDKKIEHTENTPEKKVPGLTSPIVGKIWIAPRIEGERYYEGHYMYVIERGSIWKMQ